jgi:hypothetical protein
VAQRILGAPALTNLGRQALGPGHPENQTPGSRTP